MKREALRGKLKELEFYKFQQSVWVFPYDCQNEIELLQKFFGLSSRQLNLVVGAIKEDSFLRKHFKLL